MQRRLKGERPQVQRDAATTLRPPPAPPEEGESGHVASSCMATFEDCGGNQEGCAKALAAACRSGTPYWIRHADGAGPGLGLARVQEDGSALVTGAFTGDVTFGRGEPHALTLRSTNSIDEDMFVARYRPDGALHWARRAGGPSTDRGVAVAALPDEGAIVAGTMLGEATFPPSRTDWRLDGVLALSLTKKDSCMPDAMDKGCDEVKLRGHFRAFPIMQ